MHFRKEGNPARKRIMDLYCSLSPELLVVIAKAYGDDEVARQTCLRALIAELARRNVAVLVLDTRGERDSHDNVTITAVLRAAEADLHFSHRGSRDEPLLGLPDAFGWCYGAGDRWRKQIGPFILVELEPT